MGLTTWWEFSWALKYAILRGFSWHFNRFFMVSNPWKTWGINPWKCHEKHVKTLWIYHEYIHRIFMGFHFIVNLRIFCVNGEHFLTSCSTFGSQLKTGSDVERRTRKTSSIIIILRKIGCATKKLFVSRVALKYSVGYACPYVAIFNPWLFIFDLNLFAFKFKLRV